MKKEHLERLENQLRIHWGWLKDTDYLTTYEFIEAVINKTKVKCIKCGKEFETSHLDKKHCPKCQAGNLIKILKNEKI